MCSGLVGGHGDAPPRWVKESAPSTYCNTDPEKVIDHRDSDIEAIIVVTAMFWVVMVDVLFHHTLVVVSPFVVPIPIMVSSIAITVPAVIPVTVTILPAMLVAIPVRIPFALLPSVMVPWWRLVVVMISLVVPVPSIPSATISPSIGS